MLPKLQRRFRLVLELGHLLFWEDPDGFASAVTSFLLPTRRLWAPAVPGRTAAIYGTFDLNVTCRGRSMMPQCPPTRWRAVPTSRG